MDDELSSLIKKLRDESSFVHSEKRFLIDLYSQLVKKSEQLFNKQWIIGKQHILLDDLIFGRNKLTSHQLCTKFASLESRINFIESYKVLGHNDYYVAEFLKCLRDKPKHLALLIVKNEKQQINCLVDNQQLIPILFQSLYGNCVLVQDEYYCLQLLNHLIEIQFSQSGTADGSSSSTNNLISLLDTASANVDLRRLIRKQSCSFNILFKLYTSFSHSAQLFLTAALYEPITQILTDEWFLDVDPDKALARFSTEEIINKFGHPSSKEYKLKTQKYREKIVNSLYTIAMSFIDSINANLFCFPSSLIWLVNQLYHIVSRNNSKSTSSSAPNQQDTARKLCCDIIMALYICPAICDPEPYGVVTDLQISTVARHNLIQIANILQVLAMCEDDKDSKAQDLYSKFRNNCVSDILNSIISIPKMKSSNGSNSSNLNDAQSLQLELINSSANAAVTVSGSTMNHNILTDMSSNISTSSSITNSSNFILVRTSILVSTLDLHRLMIYFRQLIKEQAATNSAESDEIKWLKSIFPFDYLKLTLETIANQMNSQRVSSTNTMNRPPSMHQLQFSQSMSGSNSPLNNNVIYNSDSTEVILSLLKDTSQQHSTGDTTDAQQQILAININDKGMECPGMLSEDKVINEYENNSSAASVYLKQQHANRTNRSKFNTLMNKSRSGGTGGAGNGSDGKDTLVKAAKSKANAAKSKLNMGANSLVDENEDYLDTSFEPGAVDSRMKLPSDTGVDRDEIRSRLDGSVGISEANECASISSNDDEDEANRDRMNDGDDDDDDDEVNRLADGLSDFDNFSGRDTPIISGRDTPSSHSHEDLQNTSSSNRNNSNSIQANVHNAGANQMITTSGGNNMNTLIPRGPPGLPVTVQKANREDINDKFCKFEINKINLTKEEQLSETGWSLDADPPESVNNDTINDRLGLEENSLLSVSSSSANTVSTYSTNSRNNSRPILSTQTSQNAPNTTPVTTITSTANNQQQQQQQNPTTPNDSDYLILMGNAAAITTTTTTTPITNPIVPVSSSAPVNSTNQMAAKNIQTVSSSNSLTTATTAAATTTHGNENELLNLDDRFSVVSDNAAWGNDLTNNSDSDFESNSPSKYTPYSTYSSNYSSSINTHPNLNQSLMNEIAAAAAAAAAANSTNSNQSNQASPLNSANNRPNSAHSSEQSTATSTGSSNQGKNKLSSISNSVKFSLTNTLNNLSNSNHKKSGLQRIFPSFKSNKPQANESFSNPLNALNTNAPSTFNSATNAQSDNQLDNGIDNILKKYSTKPVTTSNPQPTEGQLIDLSIPTANTVENSNAGLLPKNTSSNSLPLQDDRLSYDSNNLEQSKLYLDAKKKLRIVLSWSDNCTYNFMPIMQLKSSKDNFLTMYLKTQLYDAISLQDKEKEAQLYETIRCVSVFSEQECGKLMRSLKKDYTRRVFYMTYLTKSKQNVLYSLNLVDKLVKRSEWHQKLCAHRLATVITRLFLETKENEFQMYKFINDFRNLDAVDEKYDVFRKYIQQMKKDFDSIWTGCPEEIVQLGTLCLERHVLSKVYSFVMFPNGDVDHYRDSKVSECFTELSNVITPSHPLIGIPDLYLNECPWIAAQMELKKLNIYKTPQDKLACIRKCLLTIQNLLAIAKSPVCADDLHPVLIYVIIKANPPTFLSNVQYIEGFYGSRLEAEDYYWAQFIFAFSYIKSLLNNKVSASN